MDKPIFMKIQTINDERSFLIVLPKECTNNLQLSKGDYVRIYQVDGKIIIENTLSENINRYGYDKFLNKKFSEKLNKLGEKTNDYYAGKVGIDNRTKDTIIEYCSNRVKEILTNSSKDH